MIKDITVVGVSSRLSIGRRMKKLEVSEEDLERSILRFATFWSLHNWIHEFLPKALFSILRFPEKEILKEVTHNDKKNKKKEINRICNYSLRKREICLFSKSFDKSRIFTFTLLII